MSWRDMFISGRSGAAAGDGGLARAAEWESALAADRLPSFVTARLAAAKDGKAPWIATMSPAELMLARHKGVRPLAMVSGTCWWHYGFSWTNGHAEGWHAALNRLREEALAVGANAVLDVRLRTTRLEGGGGDSMDFTVLGTAVRVDGMEPSTDPVVATVPALEFMRLLAAGIVPVGIAIGAHYEWLTPYFRAADARNMPFSNVPLNELGDFWEHVRRRALLALAHDAQRQGTGVLAHTHFGELIRRENGENPPRFLGRHIVVGTVVHTTDAARSPVPPIRTVVDMRDEGSPLTAPLQSRSTYPVGEEGGAI
jgi:hypothetical protein